MPAQLETNNQESRNCISSGFFVTIFMILGTVK